MCSDVFRLFVFHISIFQSCIYIYNILEALSPPPHPTPSMYFLFINHKLNHVAMSSPHGSIKNTFYNAVLQWVPGRPTCLSVVVHSLALGTNSSFTFSEILLRSCNQGELAAISSCRYCNLIFKMSGTETGQTVPGVRGIYQREQS